MSAIFQFIKLMKSEPTKKKHQPWVIDESKCLSLAEVEKLRKNSKETLSNFTAIRNFFMIELGLNAGLRVDEMASLTCGSLLIDQARSSIVVIGKGKKKRSVWIGSTFKQTCLEYLAHLEKAGFSTDRQAPLLPNKKGQQIHKRSLQKFFKQLIDKAGLPSHYSIHCLRHTYATFLLEASNHNYRFVQKQLGHASIRTTQVYITVLETEGRKAIEKLYRKEI